ncbi:hypothetical protein J6590_075369 [Homalodisca vitripennis]|nr:hypothetical protein J6590_075369 [Homalodisca vitripennis]
MVYNVDVVGLVKLSCSLEDKLDDEVDITTDTDVVGLSFSLEDGLDDEVDVTTDTDVVSVVGLSFSLEDGIDDDLISPQTSMCSVVGLSVSEWTRR